MADKTIQELPQASTLTGEELVLLEQNSEAKKASSGAFITKVAEEVASTNEFEERISEDVAAYLLANPIGIVGTLQPDGTLYVEDMNLVADFDSEVF